LKKLVSAVVSQTMMKTVALLTFAVASELEDLAWRDGFGWGCRDYGRVPEQCDSLLAVSEEGIHVSDACFACNHRRRQSNNALCLQNCQSDFTTCESGCRNTLQFCQLNCPAEIRIPTPMPVGPPTFFPRPNGGIDWWIPVLIILATLCLLCLLLGLLYMLCRPSEVGDCNSADSQPMVVQSVPVMAGSSCGGGQPCEMSPCAVANDDCEPCGATAVPYASGGYGQSGYSYAQGNSQGYSQAAQ